MLLSRKRLLSITILTCSCPAALRWKIAFGFEVIRIQGRRLCDLPSLFDAIQDGLKRLAFINGHIVNLHERECSSNPRQGQKATDAGEGAGTEILPAKQIK
jgi:hypothetical protein